MMPRLEAHLRLWSGLVVSVFVVVHLLNLSLGIISIDAMDTVRSVVSKSWRSVPGTVLLYGALIVHFIVALRSLYRRSTLRMQWWEALQAGAGVLIPLLLISHALAARLTWQVNGLSVEYLTLLAIMWQSPGLVIKQIFLLVAVWLHVCIGLHYWLRLQAWYRMLLPGFCIMAGLIPAAALWGFVAGGLEIKSVVDQVGGFELLFPDWALVPPEDLQWLDTVIGRTMGAYLAVIAAVLGLRTWQRRRGNQTIYRIRHANGNTLTAPVGRSLLEAVRTAGIPHASICGGRARCTTCRVRVGSGAQNLTPPTSLEARALSRIGADPNVRLACQTRPREDITITPLVPADTTAQKGVPKGRTSAAGRTREQQIASLFVDLRGSTGLAETRLPFDVVFILNQFFAAMSRVLERTGGHYAQFMGDGLLALYGLNGNTTQAARQAIAAAVMMQQELNHLNDNLASELNEPLRIGIGLHLGNAIVGSMGPPSEPIISAIGDDVNVAARLEQQCKNYGCTLIVSKDTIAAAEIHLDGFRLEELAVRGRGRTIAAYIVDNPLDIPDADKLITTRPAKGASTQSGKNQKTDRRLAG